MIPVTGRFFVDNTIKSAVCRFFCINEIQKDMNISSGRFVTYGDINVDEIDIYEDAWGLNTEFADVVTYLRELETIPEEHMANKLLLRLTNLN